MPDILSDEQRQFLQLLRLPVPGDPPPELAQAKTTATAAGAVADRSAPASMVSVPGPTPLPIPAEKGAPVAGGAAPATAPSSAEATPIPVSGTPSPPTVESLAAQAPAAPVGTVSAAMQRVTRIATLDWRDLSNMVSTCQACPLGETRKHAVFGAGNPRGSWLFVGEAPGAEEDRRGEAFVGRAGQLLDNMLQAMGLSRDKDAYIANILKCRPPNNRDPLGPEVQACTPYLQRQIALLQPRVIVALGRFAAQGLLQVDTPLSQLRGTIRQYQGIPLIVTYHPAYLLRNPIDKRKVWEDLKRALGVFAELPTPIQWTAAQSNGRAPP
ncbi:MAG: uracil-DNA glycosylase [Acidithiobacillus ferrooxidans]|nr:uracil-DNA glycosylase [Acidithiobacillus ferrooxidans]MDD5003720.1 uracil-DNA glycosylase [Acidithiobacillus sp.]MDD5379797.1 uracil-DNA glycosylase [Acidithiobacillus sp.]MDD5576839.1 uracil-DNA glycosylase [Acidithiobacillus sp.]